MQSDNSTLEKELKLRVEARLYPAIKASMESIRINDPAILEKRRYTIINKFIDNRTKNFTILITLLCLIQLFLEHTDLHFISPHTYLIFTEK